MSPGVYLRPIGLVAQPPLGATRLTGGRFGFMHVEIITRADDGRMARHTAPVPECRAWSRAQGPAVADRVERLLGALEQPRAPLAGIDLGRPRLMAVLNVTPDSFSDGGLCFDPDHAITRGLELHEAGADIIDVGGESTRPGAAPVTVDEELRRVIPVVTALATRGVRVSIDSRHAPVMRAALAAGAKLINDISGLTGDVDSLTLARSTGAPVVLMHMLGEPGTMQTAPHYADAALDVFDWLEARRDACIAVGIPPERLCVDPGIGFGKTLEHNLAILRNVALFHGLGVAVLIGVSRKRFISALSHDEPPHARLPGTIAAGLTALAQGCQLLRIHDLGALAQARAVWEALHPAGDGAQTSQL